VSLRPHQQAACVRLRLDGKVIVDFRYPSDPRFPGSPSEIEIWLEVWQRRDPDAALVIGGEVRYRGGFASDQAVLDLLLKRSWTGRVV
jgi:hypothetical protein